MKKKRNTAIFITFLLSSLLLVGCANDTTASSNIPSSGSANDDIVTQSISILLPVMTQEDMMEQSTLIVRGTVTEQSEPFQIAPANGADPSNFMDYTVSVQKVLRGDSSKQSVTVRVQGGTTNGISTVCEESAELPQDTELLLYLYAPHMGMQYNTEGDYYYVTGMYRGVYTLDTSGNNETFVNEHNADDPDLEAVWQADELEAVIAAYTKQHPVNENAMREQGIAQSEQDLASGAISQDEYEQQIKDIDAYATIVKEDFAAQKND